jgi:NADH:ubiquinone oxidoreductase subunit E
MRAECKCSETVEKFEKLGEFIKTIKPENATLTMRRSAMLPALYKAQEIFGFLPEEVQEFVAEKLDIHLAEVFGVVSFYSYFTMKKQGKYRISVCAGTACHIKGADKVLKKFSDELGIEEGEVSPDGLFSLDSLRCVGACGLAPVVLVNEKVYGNVTPETVKMILKECEE